MDGWIDAFLRTLNHDELDVVATYVNVKEADLIYVRAGLFHGTEPLGQVRQTKEVSHSIPRWEEWIKFDDIFYIDLPRATKLCVSVCAVKRRKNREETTMLCWGNIGKSLSSGY